MGSKTKIEWCDATWNPVTGCLHGCKYCYARRIAERFNGNIEYILSDYPVLNEKIMARHEGRYGGKPYKQTYPFGFTPTFHRYRLDIPAGWKEPKTIFVCSMADMFGEWVPEGWIEEVMATTKKKTAQKHRYLFLTKNPERYRKLADAGKLPKKHWYGTTAATPEDIYAWTDGIRAKYNWFLSVEPMHSAFSGMNETETMPKWIIIGAETGNRKGKIVPQKRWIMELAEKADLYGIPVFMKDSLVEIIGEENMRREFPWEAEALLQAGKEAGQPGDFPTLLSAT